MPLDSKLVALGLSGGVDSSVAAYLLKQQGYRVLGIFMRNWHDTTGLVRTGCSFEQDVEFAEMVARRLRIEFQVVDLSAEYREKVVNYLFDEYAQGRTPNPDVLCNREIKFQAFWEVAQQLGAAHVATGHYCKIANGQPLSTHELSLLTGVDKSKDQSYFLCQVSQEQLHHALFPVGGLLKSQVRAIALEQRLPTAQRKDSYGICFVGEVNLPTFLAQRLAPKEGDMIEIPTDAVPLQDSQDLTDLALPYPLTPEMGSVIGKHQGAQFYTIGQRKGLHIGGKPQPLFVVGIDTDQNIVYVAQGAQHTYLYRPAARLLPATIHWIRPTQAIHDGEALPVLARLRHRQPLQEATLIAHNGQLYLRFAEPQRGITPGQFAAWYRGEELLGSATIAE